MLWVRGTDGPYKTILLGASPRQSTTRVTPLSDEVQPSKLGKRVRFPISAPNNWSLAFQVKVLRC